MNTNNSNKFGKLRYPLDIPIEADTDYFMIEVLEKKPRPLGSYTSFTRDTNINTDSGDYFNRSVSDRKGFIFLPMPLGIADGNNVDWADGSLNFLESMASNEISNLFNAFANSDGSFESIANAFGGSLTGAAEKFARALSNENVRDGALSGINAQILKSFGSNISPNQLFSRTSGKVLNPNLELLFNGPTLRQHSFTFKLSPRSKLESTEVKKIIFYLKKCMAPGLGETRAFLNSPYVFKIGFKKGSKDHPFLFSMKTCGMKSLEVNYSASTQENYSSYYDGTPTTLDLKMSFTELSPVYKEDYDEFEDFERGVGW